MDISIIKLVMALFSAFNMASASVPIEPIEPIEPVIIDMENPTGIDEEVPIEEETVIIEDDTNIDNEDKIKMEVFFSYQCGHCAKFYETTSIIRGWGDVDVQYINFPIGSTTPSKAAICAGEQNRFLAMHDLIFKNRTDFTEAAMKKHAETIKLDLDAFDACMTNPETENKVEQDKIYGISRGINSVPTSFIEGEKVVGNVPIENLERIIRKYK